MSFERTMPKKFLKSNYHVIWYVNKFLKYILLIMLLQLFQFFPFALLYPAPPIPSSNPPTIVHVHGSCVGSLAAPFPILYFISPQLFCNCRFVLLFPSPLHALSHTPFSSGNHQDALHIHDSVSVLLVCLVWFLDSIVDRYVIIAILLFIVFIFFLNKSL